MRRENLVRPPAAFLHRRKAAVLHAPELAGHPNPTIIQADPRPDWYLLWYYAVLALTPHYMESYLMILVPIIIGLLFVLLPLIFNRGERSISRRPWSVAVFVVLVVLTMWYEGKTTPWSPDFEAKPLSAKTIGVSSGRVCVGAQLLFRQGCEACHVIAGQGGHRGPDLSTVADRLTDEQLKIRILNGGNNMPAFGGILKPQELDLLLIVLESRSGYRNVQAMR